MVKKKKLSKNKIIGGIVMTIGAFLIIKELSKLLTFDQSMIIGSLFVIVGLNIIVWAYVSKIYGWR